MATQNNPEKKDKSKFQNLIMIILLLFVLMLLTSGVAYFVAKNIAGNNKTVVEQSKSNITYDAGEFLTNLSDKGYIRLSLVYLLNSKDVENELKLKESEIRDKIFVILRSETYDSIKDSEGMENLRKKIKESLNQILTNGSIVDVYFTSIIVN
ncbi:Flagellar basal body-associated protein FliL [Tepidanaerobacter acetatoxydans Re1]|uniref:Flagellar protein FliL n=1 Tax=Tepidanaerobacter acetatoxydans (strain DSM 21804 / JCM 16047 / Re1) TaxID=1209989 RepID=F4LTP8_TEPAE|nr:flagellar basal body-associated FliL family protein [Tepidanaerobacter acetatoxydans]AEE91378.1 flagellar basal body-associated protein FliL [Tepidanaerobacter acetatoxydans Re1]CCP26075.1 Flagellar basal body-associated protein FliL [Tepidanaerobacter acetatoxydans Re1]